MTIKYCYHDNTVPLLISPHIPHYLITNLVLKSESNIIMPQSAIRLRCCLVLNHGAVERCLIFHIPAAVSNHRIVL